jgi:predicted transglutaminase-like cysteine proteinase
MKTLLLALSVAALGGCASSAFDRQAEFPLERYAGNTPFMQLLDKVNLEANQQRPCAQIRRCQETLPSRDELQHTAFLDAKGYSLAKAYALQDAGVDESRMRVAELTLMGRSHMVLVVDNQWVLDNAYTGVRRVDQYEKFHVPEQLASAPALPVTLMAEGRPGSAAVGR